MLGCLQWSLRWPLWLLIKRGGVGGGGAMARLGLEPSGPVSRSGRPYKGGDDEVYYNLFYTGPAWLRLSFLRWSGLESGHVTVTEIRSQQWFWWSHYSSCLNQLFTLLNICPPADQCPVWWHWWWIVAISQRVHFYTHKTQLNCKNFTTQIK